MSIRRKNVKRPFKRFDSSLIFDSSGRKTVHIYSKYLWIGQEPETAPGFRIVQDTTEKDLRRSIAEPWKLCFHIENTPLDLLSDNTITKNMVKNGRRFWMTEKNDENQITGLKTVYEEDLPG